MNIMARQMPRTEFHKAPQRPSKIFCKPSPALMHRFLIFCTALGVAVTCSAQMPYEFFSFQSLEPIPSHVQPPPAGDLIPTAAPLSYLSLDDKTNRGGDLTLVEPFAPPIGVYKRYGVLSEVALSSDNTWIIVPPAKPNCKLYRQGRSPASHAVFRSGVVQGSTTTADEEIPLPSTDPQMAIVSVRISDAHANPRPNGDISIYRCDGDVYMAKIHRPGAYRIDYEVASPPNAGIPQSPDIFGNAHPKPPKTGDISDLRRRERLLNLFEDTPIYPNDRRTFRDVIVFFQNFISEPLDILEDDASLGDDLIKRIVAQRKGLCRHRAFLLMLAAEIWGYEVRIVYNEAHAFVEIKHGGEWIPIELGGQADSLRIVSPDFKRSQTVSWRDALPAAPLGYAPDNAARSQTAAQRREILHFVPYGTIQPQVFRNSAMQYRGRLYRKNGDPYANQRIQIAIVNGERSFTSPQATTNAQGAIDISIEIPANWPLGISQITWFGLPDAL